MAQKYGGCWQRSTWVKSEQICRSYIIPNLGQVKIQNLRPEHIQNLYSSLLDQEVGDYIIIKVHTVLHSALQQATRTGMISRNPASYAQPPKEPATEMAILNESQVSHLLVAANGHRWEALYHLAIVTGMRQMELLGLKWTDLNWIKQTLKVERQLERSTSEQVKFAQPKTNHGRRTLALGDQSMAVLRRHYERQNEERKAAGRGYHTSVYKLSLRNGMCQ